MCSETTKSQLETDEALIHTQYTYSFLALENLLSGKVKEYRADETEKTYGNPDQTC